MGKITINQFLSGAQKDSLKALLDYNIKLYKRISRLQAYIDSYRRKIELIHNFFKSSDFSFNVQQFGRELKNLNLEMMKPGAGPILFPSQTYKMSLSTGYC